MKHQITISVDGFDRYYDVTDEQLINKDWNEVLQDMLDSINKGKLV